MKYIFPAVFALCFLYGCTDNPKPTPPPETTTSGPVVPVIDYSLVATHPHDQNMFTEGLLFHEGRLLESSGAPEDMPQTRSVIGITNLADGAFTKKAELDRSKYFGEGITVLGDKLYQLTYKNQEGFIYDAHTFKQTGKFTYNNAEGWSLTTDGTSLIMSDGTDKLTYIDPATMKPSKTLAVTENGSPCSNLNELEYIKGFIYANVWMTNYIVKIDPSNGHVTGKLDLGSLTYEALNKNPRADVLNGIAYDPATDKVYVTGKMWQNIYEIRFAH